MSNQILKERTMKKTKPKTEPCHVDYVNPLEFAGLGDPSQWERKDSTASRIRRKCDELAQILIAKNAAYGDSALSPIQIFAHGKASELIRVRMDDKLSRIANNPGAFGEDPVMDLLGYLILFSLAVEDES